MDVTFEVRESQWESALKRLGNFAEAKDIQKPTAEITKLLYKDVEYTASTPTPRLYKRTFNLLNNWRNVYKGKPKEIMEFANRGTVSPAGVPYARKVMSGVDQASIHRPKIYWGDRTIEKTAERVAEDVPEIYADHLHDYLRP